MRIGLLECDDVVGRFPGVPGGYREMFADLLSPHLENLQFAYYRAFEGSLPQAPTDCDAWLCSGSQYSTYDAREWIGGLAGFIRGIAQSGRPFVGICFGHQMLAHAMGGEVAKARQGWGAGVLPVEMLRQEPWMEPPRREIRIQHMHQDQVQKLPPDSVLLGRSPHCEVGMFRVGERMLGIEGHPEFTTAFGEALIRSRREKIGAPRAQEALESLARPADGPVLGRWIARYLRS
jgi:GMP synthase-like glutamine amidotransferase